MKKAALILAAALGMTAIAHAQASTATNEETLPSGVRIQHLTKGTGAQPTASDNVTVNYRGTLLATGAEFDSSYNRGRPASFGLRGVIPCWTQGVATMRVGEKAKLTCPASTAYGARGAGGVIPPNADLIFEIELLGIN
jgi:FKBP-type peptidyl-prolyl cis-trans isomerase FkpA